MTGRHCCVVCFSDEHLSPEWCPHVTIDDETGVRIIEPPTWRDGVTISAGDAYDVTQTCDDMRDGDLIVCTHENGERIVAVLLEAWPTRMIGPRGDVMHELDSSLDWATFESGKYLRSYEAAQRFTHTHTSTKEQA
jgi:hypothetical protein